MDAWEEIGKSGYKICRFKLRKIDASVERNIETIKEGALVKLEPSGKEPKWFSIDVEPPVSIKAQRISSSSQLAKQLMDKGVGDVIDFGDGFKVLEIKRYMSS